MSGGSGPTPITPLPAGGGVIKSTLWSRPPPVEITPLPAGGGIIKVSWGGGWRVGDIRIGPDTGGW